MKFWLDDFKTENKRQDIYKSIRNWENTLYNKFKSKSQPLTLHSELKPAESRTTDEF